MYEVRVTADFAAAHFLKDYNGKCENLHGHNYTVYAHVAGDTLDDGGMLLDFTKLKACLREVCARLDHTNLNDMSVFSQNPSAERIAKYIADSLLEKLPELQKAEKDSATKKGSAFLKAVDVFETPTSRARYLL